MGMDLDELRERWAAHDAGSVRLDRERLRVVLSVERSLRATGRALMLEVVVAAAGLLWLGSFLFRWAGEPRTFAPALLLHALLIAWTAMTVRQMVAARAVRMDAPVLAVQRQVEHVHVLQLRTTLAALVLSPLLWTLSLAVGVPALTGRNAVDVLGWHYVLATFVFAAVFAAAAVLGIRRWGRRSERMRRVANSLTGASLHRARERLAALAKFERDPGGAS